MIETEQNPYTIEIKKKLSAYEIEAIFGTTNIGILYCSDMSDEEVDRIVEKWNSIPEEYPIRAYDLNNILERAKENEQ